MINPKYGIKSLRQGFERNKRYCKLPISIRVSKSTVSFYVKRPSTAMGTEARVSNHHPNIQNYTNDGAQPWTTENVSIEFIIPNSDADTSPFRARVYQNAGGTIQPFDVTVSRNQPLTSFCSISRARQSGCVR